MKMAKKIIQTPEESELYRETMALVKRANQRLLRMERATGEKGTFAAKQLYDYLSSSNLDAITKASGKRKGGRISLKKSYSETQLRSIKKATEEYLNEETSTVRGAKKYAKKVSKQAGKPIDLTQASTIYQVRDNYQWIYEYFPGSSFWAEYGNPVKKGEMTEGRFVEEIYKYINEINGYIDESLRGDLENLYYYCLE